MSNPQAWGQPTRSGGPAPSSHQFPGLETVLSDEEKIDYVGTSPAVPNCLHETREKVKVLPSAGWLWSRPKLPSKMTSHPEATKLFEPSGSPKAPGGANHASARQPRQPAPVRASHPRQRQPPTPA